MTTYTMVWVQKHVHDVRNSTKTVLAYLAFRAHFDDGTASWPSIATIAADCGIDERTVQRAIKELVDKGYLELGQQGFSAFNPKTGKQVRADRRSVVWNVILKDSGIEAEDVEETSERGIMSCVRHARKAAARRAAAAETTLDTAGSNGSEPLPDKMSPREDARSGQNVTPCPISNDVDNSGVSDILSKKPDKMSPNNTSNIHNPSAPTGHLPASGATPIEDGIPQPCATAIDSDGLAADPGSDAGADVLVEWVESSDDFDAFDTAAVDTDAVADRVLSSLESLRRHEGLTTRPANAADRRAVAALDRRLASEGVPSPESLMLDVLAYATLHDWHAKHVDSGRRFARTFDSLRNDMAVDDRSAGRRRARDGKATDIQSQSPAAPPSRPTPVPPDHRPRTVDLERSERNRRDLAAYAAAHGGSCFAGNWPRELREVGS
ncbi:helix-turn-helix domain-containing protein [Bifidobacterium sp. SO1]|uniref:helix-turn-helix domain-containing protein n=1 Tax=Bifidobacterium sp. SO1 TaxID=2809029 RepID=UPI001BDD3342|nr:helix-turn-helix domain-containing protein [Bifidobacterium sp. SO1]MBT1160942.1 helix-turn-helix domain-containing protein [Bifidobacterium sp. SO1]